MILPTVRGRDLFCLKRTDSQTQSKISVHENLEPTHNFDGYSKILCLSDKVTHFYRKPLVVRNQIYKNFEVFTKTTFQSITTPSLGDFLRVVYLRREDSSKEDLSFIARQEDWEKLGGQQKVTLREGPGISKVKMC